MGSAGWEASMLHLCFAAPPPLQNLANFIATSDVTQQGPLYDFYILVN